ncbi:hypothetical protein [Flavihumibacter profundi]|uniref:hypothetical protein n=1 Tax=Flavihumibacter profundi TaxID=2716883 RepID=UPI001CC652AA|nr:hypothetical protein [Flavihumibacter profundi]MBZ5857667.1 hypothetical protein [Flavihumibacter profundi]
MIISFPEEQVKHLHSEFQNIRTYNEKIIFFDTWFGLLADPYPGFNPKLDIFFRQEATNELIALFEKERRHSLVLEKIFDFEYCRYNFNITPINSYAEVLNDYIISKFVDSDNSFKTEIEELRYKAAKNYPLVENQKKEINKCIGLVTNKLNSNTESSFRVKFMTVFYDGYSDYTQNNYKKFSKRKKIIELFLYSYGILFGKYMEALNGYPDFNAQASDKEANEDIPIDLKGRMSLLRESGILDFLHQKYYLPDTPDAEQKIAEIICQLLGMRAELPESVINYLKYSKV